MKVGILGSGNGAMAVAFEWAQAGHDIFMFDFPQFSENIKKIVEKGGITSKGDLEGFEKIRYAGHDIEKVLKDAKIIFAVGPAYSTEVFAKECKPYVQDGQIYIVCPGSCAGSLVFKNAIGLEISDERIIIGETSTLPYAVRITGDAEITIFNRLKGDYFVAALPSSMNNRVYDAIKEVYSEAKIAQNIMQTTLQNANPIIHPSITLLNAALIERKDVGFLLYEEGVTQATGRLMESLDMERIAISKAFGVEVKPDPEIGIGQGYMTESSYDIGYSKAPGFKGIMGPDTIDFRYLNEDAGYGLVFFIDLANFLDVKVPTMESVVQLSSVIRNVDYIQQKARTMKTLKISQYSLDELKEIL